MKLFLFIFDERALLKLGVTSILFLKMGSFFLFGAEIESTPPSEASSPVLFEPPRVHQRTYLDKTHSFFSKNVIDFANWVDSFFGDERIDEETKKDHVRLRLSSEIFEKGELELKAKVNAKFALPHLKNKLHLILGGDAEEETQFDQGGSQIRDDLGNLDEIDLTTAIRYMISATKRWNIHMDAGIRLHSPAQPFLKLWTRRIFDRDPWAFRFTQTLWWFEKDGFKAREKMDIEKKIHANLFFRASSKVEWKEEKEVDGVHLDQTLSLFKYLRRNRIFVSEIAVTGKTRPNTRLEAYHFKLAYRRNLYQPWLFFEIQPKVSFPRERNFKATPMILFQFEIIFGHLKPLSEKKSIHS